MSLEQAVLLFAVFAFAGWLLEVAYRSWLQKRFVNAGFLHGPFLPIYGLGALFVLGCDALLRDFFLYATTICPGWPAKNSMAWSIPASPGFT